MSDEAPQVAPKLTNKQRVFISEYLRDFNASRAARAAGYSERTAKVIGRENLTKPYIAAEISSAISERAMGADEVLLRLAEIARGDIGDFLDIGPMGFVVDLNAAKEAGKTHLLKKAKMRSTTSVNKDGVETETHDMEIELYSALEALVTLAKHHGLLIERKDITSGGQPIQVVSVGLDTDKL